MLIQPFSELGATNEGQRTGQRFARRAASERAGRNQLRSSN
jgi:hypothetical protein